MWDVLRPAVLRAFGPDFSVDGVLAGGRRPSDEAGILRFSGPGLKRQTGTTHHASDIPHPPSAMATSLFDTHAAGGTLTGLANGQIAQLVEHSTENAGVPGSSPGLAIFPFLN